MCQVSKTKKFIKLEEDLIVYKTMFQSSNGDLYSHHHNFPYILGKYYSMLKREIKKDVVNCSDKTYHIYKGFHSYVNIIILKHVHFSVYVMVECVIPKGSYIIRGEFLGDETIVSNKIIINKILNKL